MSFWSSSNLPGDAKGKMRHGRGPWRANKVFPVLGFGSGMDDRLPAESLDISLDWFSYIVQHELTLSVILFGRRKCGHISAMTLSDRFTAARAMRR